ncbi:MAG TPA: MBL fold metallo-hydrolase [Solirubrobacterales bacterium]|nr:MBL fold metallo-hydrolase [Solirubrobacterales bacterium]
MSDEGGIQEPPMVDTGAIEEVAPGVHVIPDKRVEFVPNVGIVEGERAVLVIDTAMGHVNGQSILDAAARIAGERKLFLTTTHFHPEHAFGAKPFEGGVTYVINQSQAEELAAKGPEYVEMFSTFGPGLAQLLADVELVPPDLTYEGQLRIELGGRVVELLDLGPAHTRGDQLIWLPEERIVFAGDLVENAFFPILPDPDANGVWWLEALDKIAALGPATVVGGHGAVGGPKLLDAFREYLERVRDRTAELAAAGSEPGEVVTTIEAEVLASYEGWGNEVWIKSAVESFQGGAPA